MRPAGIALWLVAAVTLHAPRANAQTSGPRSRVEIGAGLLWAGSLPLGARPATETTSPGGTSVLFNSSSQLSGAAGLSGRIGVRVTRSLVVEGDASYLKPQVRVSLSGDAESAPPITAIESVEQYTFGAKALWYLARGRSPSRLAPFAMAGGGYLRQLHEQATLVETGRFFQIGGGVSAMLATRPHFHTKGAGLRFDVSALIRSQGVAFDDEAKTSPAAGVSVFVRF